MTPNSLIIHKIKKGFEKEGRKTPFSLGFGIHDPSNASAMISEENFNIDEKLINYSRFCQLNDVKIFIAKTHHIVYQSIGNLMVVIIYNRNRV